MAARYLKYAEFESELDHDSAARKSFFYLAHVILFFKNPVIDPFFIDISSFYDPFSVLLFTFLILVQVFLRKSLASFYVIL